MMLKPNQSCGDEQLLDQAIAEYLRAESAGKTGERQQWFDRYPACAAGLMEFFEDRERVERLVTPARANRPAPSSSYEPTGIFEYPKVSAETETVDLAPKPPQFAKPRYRPLNFHAQGGMGEVWLAHDERIGRRVAIKKLRPEREAKHARFLVEAQVTGQLEHPSVVPMHDLGTDDTGQPFYIMKFIEGQILKEAIADFHTRKTSTDWPRDVAFLRLLQTYINVCYAIAYAHSKGVLHRDIKPDNVMIGPYGETLVLDWGLAKVVAGPDLPSDPPVRVSVDDLATTQDGTIVGTPVYMSPEGAQGHGEAVDRASDVYLLGATLYEILTARPPRHGSSRWELIDLARTSRPVSPRKLDPRIPRALEAICSKAMAFHKSDRYPTAIALAEDVQQYLAGEPTAAYKEPLSARLGRWVRRHRRGIMRAFVIAVVLVISGFALHSHRQASLLFDREQARAQLSDFHRLADEAQYYAANSDAVSERAPYYDSRRAKAVGEAGLAVAVPWGAHAERLPLSELRADFMQTHYNLVLLMARVNLQGDREAESLRAALALLDKAATIQLSSRGYYHLRSRCLALLGQPEAAQREQERAESPDTAVTAGDYFLQGELLRVEDAGSEFDPIRDETRPLREHLAKAIEEYRNALRLDPRHYWAQFQLGRCLLALGRGPEAVEALSACVAMRPDSPWAYSTRGLASALSGRPEEALVDLDRAVQLDPSFQPARLNRGVVHWLQENTDAAMTDFTAVLAAPADKRLIEAGYYRGQLLLQMHRTREALADLSMVIDARGDFRPAYWLRAQTRFRLGSYDDGQSDLARFLVLGVRKSKGEQVDSRVAMGKTLRQMALELDGEARKQALIWAADELHAAIAAGESTAEVFRHLGQVQEDRGEDREAIKLYSQGLALSPDHVMLRNMRGWAYVKVGQLELARADYSEALRRSPDDAVSHAGLGWVLAQVGAADDARKEASAALLSGSDNYKILHNVACIYGRLSGSAIGEKLEHENLAIAALKQAVDIARGLGAGAEEEEYIRREEEAFPESLRSRPEFERLLTR